MEKVGLIDDEATDSVAFNFKSTFYFNEKRSKGLTGNEEIVMPHFILLVSFYSVFFFIFFVIMLVV